ISSRASSCTPVAPKPAAARSDCFRGKFKHLVVMAIRKGGMSERISNSKRTGSVSWVLSAQPAQPLRPSRRSLSGVDTQPHPEAWEAGLMIVGIRAAIFLAGSGPAPAPPGDETFENAEDLHRFSFEAAEDEDYDRRPDGWSRRRGPGFPQYVRAHID